MDGWMRTKKNKLLDGCAVQPTVPRREENFFRSPETEDSLKVRKVLSHVDDHAVLRLMLRGTNHPANLVMPRDIVS